MRAASLEPQCTDTSIGRQQLHQRLASRVSDAIKLHAPQRRMVFQRFDNDRHTVRVHGRKNGQILDGSVLPQSRCELLHKDWFQIAPPNRQVRQRRALACFSQLIRSWLCTWYAEIAPLHQVLHLHRIISQRRALQLHRVIPQQCAEPRSFIRRQFFASIHAIRYSPQFDGSIVIVATSPLLGNAFFV